MTDLVCMEVDVAKVGTVTFATARKQAFRGPHVETVRTINYQIIVQGRIRVTRRRYDPIISSSLRVVERAEVLPEVI